ncbi:MAG TPA: hypothetical protein VHB79_20020 [Polyangiaceae bacterium]|nr:hypothetical protein [Polyangiaceae bacterium]
MLSHRVALVSLLAAALASGGCNAVLGIDEAHDRNAGGGSNHSQLIPTATCASPHGNCATCFDGSKSYTDCLANHDCRKALDDYRQCLGFSCHEDGCLDALELNAGRAVADWVTTESCTDCVDNSPLADMCDLYCACMEQVLPASAVGADMQSKTCESFNGSELPWTSTGNASADRVACKTACKALDAGSVHCRWSHCELANSGELASHCRHAVSDTFCPKKTTANADCTDRALGGWGCHQDTDCCSGTCTEHICADF